MRQGNTWDGKVWFKIHFPAQSVLGPWISKWESSVARWSSSRSVLCHNWVSASSSTREMTQHQLWEGNVVSLFSHFLQLLCLGEKNPNNKPKPNLTKPNPTKNLHFWDHCSVLKMSFKSSRLFRVYHILLNREKASWQILFGEWTQRK